MKKTNDELYKRRQQEQKLPGKSLSYRMKFLLLLRLVLILKEQAALQPNLGTT